MRNLLFLFLFLAISHLSIAQSTQEVAQAAEKFRVAMLAEDAETLRNLTSANLSYGHSSGLVEDQAAFVAVFAAKLSDYQKWDVSNQTIAFHDKNTAIVRYNVAAEIVTEGKTNALTLGLLMVWVKEKAGWKLLARQAFRLPQP